MSDLISRSELIEEIKSLSIVLGGKQIFSDNAKDSVLRTIDEQPNAYDIDKVVEELKEVQFSAELEEPIQAETNVTELFEAQVVLLDEAIEIVKHVGVSDDCCEWEQTSTARYKTSCGYKLEEYFDTNACYCKQCGKKIKIVGD